MDSQSKAHMTMDGQYALFDDSAQLAHQLALSQLECTALKRERDLLQQELTAAREEVAHLLRVLERITEPAPRRTAPTPTGAMPLWKRILEYLETSDRPKRVWQVRAALHLPNSPGRELGQLVERHLAIRVKPGVFTVPGKDKGAEVPDSAPGVNPSSLRQRIIALAQQVGRPLRSPEIQTALGVTRPVRQELSRLVQEGKLKRVSAGRYIVPKAE